MAVMMSVLAGGTKIMFHQNTIYIVGEAKAAFHSLNSSIHVRIDEINTSGYGEEYAGARRYIN